jgi:hypothetical protein
MTNGLEIDGALLARNTLLNLAGQVIPLLIGLATIPYIVRGLGTERFGVLAIAWVVLGYFSLFDLGLGRAKTKFVAECLGPLRDGPTAWSGGRGPLQRSVLRSRHAADRQRRQSHSTSERASVKHDLHIRGFAFGLRPVAVS